MGGNWDIGWVKGWELIKLSTTHFLSLANQRRRPRPVHDVTPGAWVFDSSGSCHLTRVSVINDILQDLTPFLLVRTSFLKSFPSWRNGGKVWDRMGLRGAEEAPGAATSSFPGGNEVPDLWTDPTIMRSSVRISSVSPKNTSVSVSNCVLQDLPPSSLPLI